MPALLKETVYQQPQICRWDHSNDRKQRGTKKSLLMRVKEESEKPSLKLSIVKTKILGFPGCSDDKESACKAWVPGLIPGLGRSPGEGNANPHQYSCLENSMDRGTWWATFHGVAKSQTQLMTSTHKTIASRPITSWQTKGKGRSSNRFPLPGLSDHCRWWLWLWN